MHTTRLERPNEPSSSSWNFLAVGFVLSYRQSVFRQQKGFQELQWMKALSAPIQPESLCCETIPVLLLANLVCAQKTPKENQITASRFERLGCSCEI